MLFQWYFLSFLIVASLLSCLHQLKHENVQLEERFAELVKRRDHLLLVNSRLSKPSNLPVTVASSPSLHQDVKRADISSPLNVLENSKNNPGKSPENGSSDIADRQEASTKQQESKSQSQSKEQVATKKEQQRQRSQPDVSQTTRESSQQIPEKKSPVKMDTPPHIDERLREATPSPSRTSKATTEGKFVAVSIANIAADRPPSRQSPKSRKSPQAGGGKKAKSQEQLFPQGHQKMLPQPHAQLKQQQLNRQAVSFQPSHLLPVRFHFFLLDVTFKIPFKPGQKFPDSNSLPSLVYGVCTCTASVRASVHVAQPWCYQSYVVVFAEGSKFTRILCRRCLQWTFLADSQLSGNKVPTNVSVYFKMAR